MIRKLISRLCVENVKASGMFCLVWTCFGHGWTWLHMFLVWFFRQSEGKLVGLRGRRIRGVWDMVEIIRLIMLSLRNDWGSTSSGIED